LSQEQLERQRSPIEKMRSNKQYFKASTSAIISPEFMN
jgi:hypothetical protein